ncbi:MAG: exodeoxyribonuclease VII small subunit [Ruminococcaceae bacterium]|nr:exodeoxyribonuclease VII small subunit [Oscillospiraceae bacterium]
MDKLENKITFEEALARLEEIVRMLESGSAPLDKSLELFEEGVKLVKMCNSQLDNVEQRIKILSKGDNGEMVEKDFVGGEA